MIEGKNRELYFGNSVYKQMNIEIVGTNHVIDNSMREQDTFSLTETLCDESELRFGSCLPNKISFIGRDIPLATKGMKLRPVEILEGNEDDPFYYGEYTVYSDVPTSDRTKREITAYDAMYDIINADVKQWYSGLSFPMKLRKFRDSFFSHFGITQKETTLVNDGMTVNRTLITESSSDSNMTEVDSISGKTVVEAICEINGVFGNINRDGLFEYVELKPIINPLYPANNLFPRDDLFPREPNTVSMSGHYITFDYEDFQTKKITQLEIRPSDNTAGEKVGKAGNNYVISGNFLVSDKSGAELNGIAQNVLEVIGKVSYTPIKSSSCVGNPCLELGDPIRFNTSREIVESYILQRTLTGIQAKRDSIESHGVEYYPVNNNGIKKRVESVENRTESLEQTADEIQEDVEEFKNDTTVRFEKTENSIEAEVTRAQGAEGELSSRLSITESEISSEVAARQSADSEMSTRISQTAHSIVLSASGGDKSVGITVALYDENGKLINSSTGNANITITGFVTFNDLSATGSTNIDGARITTGSISCDRLNGGTIRGQNIVGGTTAAETLICYDKFYMSPSFASDINAMIGYKKEAFSMCWNGYLEFANPIYATVYGNADSATYADKCSNIASKNHNANCYIHGDSGDDNYERIYRLPSGSSRRYKTDIEIVNNADLDPHRLYNLDVVQFKYKPSFYDLPDGTDMPTVIGIIAEDVDEKYPCACEYNDNTGEVENWMERYLIPPMLSLIQEQHKEIELLKQENLALQNRLSILEQKMEVLENAYNNQNN